MDCQHVFCQCVKGFRAQGLVAVAQGTGRIIVHFDHDPIGPRRHSRHGHRGNQCRLAGGVAGINDDRQVSQLAQHRDGRQIQRVARVGFKGADAALAQNHLLIAFTHDVFGT